MDNKNYRPKEVMKDLKRWAKKLGRFPMHKEIENNPKLPSMSVIKRLFGSYKEAARRCGYGFVVHRYTDKELLEMLKKKASRLKKAPSRREIEKDPNMPSSDTYMRRFGSWRRALQLIGFKIPKKKIYKGSLKPKVLLERLKFLSKRLGRPPKLKEIQKDPKLPYCRTVVRVFGSYEEIVRKLGYRSARYKYSDEELLNLIRKKAKKLGRRPSKRDMDNDKRMPWSDAFADHFGSWRRACILAGYPFPKTGKSEMRTRPFKYSKKELLIALKRKIRELGRFPTIEEVDKDKNLPGFSTYIRHFGSWSKVAKLFGKEVRRPRTLNEFKKFIDKFYRKHKRVPTVPEWKRIKDAPSLQVLKKRYGKRWTQMLQDFGYSIYPMGVKHINREAELYITRVLRRAGYKVVNVASQYTWSPYSLVVNGKVRLRVAGSKGAPSAKYPCWVFRISQKKEFDYMVGVGMRKDGKVEEVFLFPVKDLSVTGIHIAIGSRSKYYKYRIYNIKEAFQSLPELKGRRKALTK